MRAVRLCLGWTILAGGLVYVAFSACGSFNGGFHQAGLALVPMAMGAAIATLGLAVLPKGALVRR